MTTFVIMTSTSLDDYPVRISQAKTLDEVKAEVNSLSRENIVNLINDAAYLADRDTSPVPVAVAAVEFEDGELVGHHILRVFD